MAEERCLFIGGPADGEVRQVQAGNPFWHVREAVPFHPTPWGREAAPDRCAVCPETIYRRELLGCPTKRWAIYIAEGMSLAEAMERLITNYGQRRA